MHTPSRRFTVTGCASLAALLGGLLLPGCASLDRQEYYSSVDLPKTITVVDPHTQQVYWSKDVPVGYRLVVDFDHPDEVAFMQAGQRPATRLKWQLFDKEDPFIGVWTRKPVEGGEMPLPGVPVLTKVAFRPAPEYPPTYMGPTAPAQKPVDTRPAPVSSEIEVVPLSAATRPAAAPK